MSASGRVTAPTRYRVNKHVPLTPERRFIYFLYAAIFLSMFPISFNTPAGFVSLVDLAMGGALGIYLLLAFSRKRLPVANLYVALLAFSAFMLVLISTLVVNHGLDVSPVVKYAVFLIIIPLVFWLSDNASPSPDLHRHALNAVTISGNVFIAFIILSLASGHTAGAGDKFSISLLGQPIYKNVIGELSVFITTANFLSFALKKKPVYLLFYVAAMSCDLFLDVRGPLFTTLIMSAVIYVSYFRFHPRHILIALGGLLGLAMLIFVVSQTGLIDQQLARLMDIGSAQTSDQDNITSTSSRLYLWRYALKLIGQNPFFGVGYGGFFFEDGRGWLYGMYEPHDNILQIMSEGGIVGFLAFAALLLVGFLRKSPSRYALGVKILALAYLTTTLVDIVWIRGSGHLFWILFFLVALSPGRQTQRRVMRRRPFKGPWRRPESMSAR